MQIGKTARQGEVKLVTFESSVVFAALRMWQDDKYYKGAWQLAGLVTMCNLKLDRIFGSLRDTLESELKLCKAKREIKSSTSSDNILFTLSLC